MLKRRSGKRHKTGGPPDPSARGDRARRTAAAGANRKATTGLVSSMLSFNEQDDVRWAQELLPTSNLGPSAHCDSDLAPPPALLESTWDRPFSGLHYAALTAPGPTGTRPEHITDLLNVPRRVHAKKIHAGAVCTILQDLRRHVASRRQVAYPHAALQATQEERQTALHQDGRVPPLSLCQAPRESGSGASAHQDSAHASVGCTKSGAQSNPWCSTARLSRWWRLTWISSTCLATPSGPTSAPLCAPSSPRLPPGPSGSTNLTPSPLCPLVARFPLIGALNRAMSLAPSRVPSSWEMRVRRICRTSSPLRLNRRALATNGSSMAGSALSGPCSLTGGFAHWTPPWPPLAPHGAALPSATPRAPPSSCVHPSEFTISADGTPPTFVTLSSFSALTQAQPLWAQPLAPVSKSTPEPGSQYAPATNCALPSTDHAPTELVLTRQCADVSKHMYHMRINEDTLDHDLFASFDGQLRASVSNSLCGDLPDHSWWQATTGVSVGGLGLRTAVTVALPAFVASRILSRTMVDHFCAAIGASRQTIMAEYDARTDEALSRLASTLPTATALELLAKLDEAYAESHLSWQNVLSGSEPAMRDQPPPCPSSRPGHHA